MFHRTVHYVAIPASSDTSARMLGWPRSGYAAGRLLAGDPEVSAVLCGNDDLAIGVMHALRDAGRPLPGAVSVLNPDEPPPAGVAARPELVVRESTGPRARP